MNELFDGNLDELLARGGTFDITGTGVVTDKQFWGFNASDGAVLAVLKGIPLKTKVTTLADIAAAEVNIYANMLTGLTDPLFAGVIYRPDEYIITNIQLTSGSLHLYKVKTQIIA